MPDPTPRSPLRSKVPDTKKTAPGTTVPGPTFRAAGDSLPCGCKFAPDEDTRKLRIYFCSPHAVAYEMMEALQQNLAVLDDILNNAPPPDDYDTTAAMEAGMHARAVLKKAKGNWR